MITKLSLCYSDLAKNWQTFHLPTSSLANLTLSHLPKHVILALFLILVLLMTMNSHISHITRAASFHLRNIGKLRKYLNSTATEQIHCSTFFCYLLLGYGKFPATCTWSTA